MKCPKCKLNVKPNLEEVKMHTKATCPECGAYIKMVGKEELDAIIEASISKTEATRVNTLVIKTKAPREYMPNVLNRVALSLQNDYISGEGRISKPFDEVDYHYEFYYE